MFSLTIKLTGGQKRSFWTSSERSERRLSALLDGTSTLQVLAKCNAGDEADEKYYACALNITLVFWQKLG